MAAQTYVGTLPPVVIDAPVEPYSPPLQVTTCDPSPKAGVVAFRDFVMQNLGGRVYGSGISRDCGIGGSSEHHEGRALDWHMNADDPDEARRVNLLVDWLLAPDQLTAEPHANFRRLGLRYLIWNRQIWSAGKKDWAPYTGSHPHHDHVHLSWSWPGARAETSFYGWLAGPSQPPVEPPAPRPWLPWALLAVGAAAGWWLAPSRWS